MYYIYLIFLATFLSIGFFFAFLDLYTPFYKLRYRTPERETLKEIYSYVGPLVCFNLFVVHPLLSYLISFYITVRRDNFNWGEFVISSIVCSIAYEIVFTLTHMLFHTK